MNKVIEKQLEKLQLAKHGGYDETKHQFIFKKIAGVKLEVGKCYLVKLNKSLTKESENDSLVYNLNRGTFPKYEDMKVDVLKISQGLIQVNGIYFDAVAGEDIREFWSGWLPVNQLEVISEI